MYNCCLIRGFCRHEGDESPEDIDLLFSPVRDELIRLGENPELFPSQDIKEAFWHKFNKILTKIKRTRRRLYQQEARHLTFLSDDNEETLAEIMPGESEWHEPWDRFLHNRALGTDIDWHGMGSAGSVQILPMAALRLLYNMKEADTSIIRGIEAVCATL